MKKKGTPVKEAIQFNLNEKGKKARILNFQTNVAL